MLWSLFKTLPVPAAALPKLSKSVTPLIFASGNLLIRNQTYEDVQQTRAAWMLAEGWPGVLHGLPGTYALDPAGFYMLERDGVKVASISMVAYPAIQFAYVGFYVVPAELRKQGLGSFIFHNTLEYTEQQRGITTIGLNCYAAMSPLYAKWGFVTHTVDDIWKFTARTATTTHATNVLDTVTDDLFAKLVQYDKTVFGTARSEFLHSSINKPNTATVLIEDQNEITGYGIISVRVPAKPEPNISYRIGPMYAQNAKIASELLARLIAATALQPEQTVFLETPGTNPAAALMVTQFGFKSVAQMDKMFKGAPPQYDDKQIFGYCSLATGG